MAMDKERDALVNLLIRLKNQIPSECMINNPEVDELHQETQRFIDVLSEQTRTSQVSYSLVTPAVDTSAPRVVIENALTAQQEPVAWMLWMPMSGKGIQFTTDAKSVAECNRADIDITPLYGPDLLAYADRVAAERDAARCIVGYIVFSGDISSAALYPISEKDAAFDAAKRWGANISALTLHPQSPITNE